jgi:hypothetical protein
MCPLDLVEIPLKMRAYTWSNMNMILFWENLTGYLPIPIGLLWYPLAKLSSDHVSIKAQIGTYVTKSHIFIFEILG